MHITYRKYNILALIMLISSAVMASPMENFLYKVKKAEGNYQVIKKNSKYCEDSDLVFVDQNDKTKGFRIGQKLFFGPFRQKSITKTSSNNCKYSDSFKYGPNSVTQSSKVYDCPKNKIYEQSRSEQSFEIDGSTIIYKSKYSKIECTFKKVKGIK